MSIQAVPRKAEVLARLTEADVQRVYASLGVRQFGKGGAGNWLVSAPFREDTHPSLSIQKANGVWHDQATGRGGSIFDAVMLTRGCDFRTALIEVGQAVGLPERIGALVTNLGTVEQRFIPIDPGPEDEPVVEPAPQLAPVEDTTPERMPPPLARRDEVIYPYFDEERTLLYEIIRKALPDGRKTFMVRRRAEPGEDSHNGFAWGLGNVRRVLYRLPELLAADLWQWTFVVEGEKDVDRLRSVGLVATTNPFGAGKWDASYSSALAGREVVVVADNDTPGILHAGNVVVALQGVAHSVRLLRLDELPMGGDLSDWFDLGGTVEALLRRVEATEPEAAAAPNGNPVAPPAPAGTPSPPATPTMRRAVMLRMSDVQPTEVKWLWPGWLPLGKLTILGGHPGTGKSTLAAAFAATLSRGGDWPDGSRDDIGIPSHSIFLLGEDSYDDTFRPRLDQLGAEPFRVHALDLVESTEGKYYTFSVAEDLPLLEEEIKRDQVRLVVIDPLTSYLPSANRNDEGDIRDLLTPLAKLAERTGCAVVGVMHVAKPSAGKRTALQSLLGATAFGAIARTVVMTAAVPDSDRNVLAVVKSNLARKPQPIEWSRPDDGAIVWHGPTSNDIECLLGGIPGSIRPERRDEAEILLRELLADGPVPSREIEEAAAEADISDYALKLARKTVGVQTRRLGGKEGGWYLMLNDEDWNSFVERQSAQAGEPAPEQDPNPSSDE